VNIIIVVSIAANRYSNSEKLTYC